MIRSMTGYSRVQQQEPEFTLAVSVKSINHRFLDLQIRLSAGLEPLEALLRNLIKEHIVRGHVEVQVNLERTGPAALELDRKLLDAYLKALQDLRRESGYASDPDLVALLRIPGMIASANGEIPSEQLPRLQASLERVTKEALDRLDDMRLREGETLERDVRARVGRLRDLATSVDRLANDVPVLYRRRLERRLQEILGSLGRTEIEPGRLAQEVAFLASRSDIAEELTRFRSHLDQIARLVAEKSEVGKKLDFLLQEMNREANTLLSKTTDVPEVGLEITQHAIEMKAEIEKLREQAQNIE
jgi:uncharacterized protein (TIGR00255 family)